MKGQQEFTWHGAYGQPGSKDRSTKTNGNKGVMANYRRVKRQQAEARQVACTDGGYARELREGYLPWKRLEKPCTCLASIRPRTACTCK